MKTKEHIDKILSDLAIQNYYWIDASEIVVAQWVRVKCQFGCSDYGLGACPPNTPSVEECKTFFGDYKRAILIRCTVFADKTNYPNDWSKATTAKLLEAERQIFISNYPKVFLLNQTCCCSCAECTGTRKDCRDKKNSRPSPESFAVDVYKTARKAGIDINVINCSPAEINRIAILLID
jgi:predicted metal-binding protein